RSARFYWPKHRDWAQSYLIGTQSPCRFQVDHELELGPLLHRQVGRFCPFEDFVNEAGRAVPHVFDASQIGEQTTRLGHLPVSADQRQTVRGHLDKLLPPRSTALTSAAVSLRPRYQR